MISPFTLEWYDNLVGKQEGHFQFVSKCHELVEICQRGCNLVLFVRMQILYLDPWMELISEVICNVKEGSYSNSNITSARK